MLNLHEEVTKEFYKVHHVELEEGGMEKLTSPLNTVLSEEKLSRMKAGCVTYFRRICFGPGIYYWKGVGLSSQLYGAKEYFDWYRSYSDSVDNYQGLLTLTLIVLSSLKTAIELKIEREQEKLKKLKK